MQKREAGWEQGQESKAVVQGTASRYIGSFIGLGMLGACSWLSGPDERARAVLVDEIQTLDPARASDPVSMELIPALFETLYEPDYASDTYRIRPLLAADLPTTSPDGLTVTIRLRSDVYFPASPVFAGGKRRRLVAADVVDSLKRVAWPELQSQGWSMLRDRIEGFQEYRNQVVSTQDRIGRIAGIQALDDSTLVLKLKEKVPHLAWILAQPWASVIAHESVTARGEEFGSPLGVGVGTGPFQVAAWLPGKKIRLIKNKDRREEVFPTEFSTALKEQGFGTEHGKNLPFLDELEFRIQPDTIQAWADFKLGLSDWVKVPGTHGSEVYFESQMRLAPEYEEKKLGLARTLGERVDWIAFQFKDPLLQDVLLRKRLDQSIDRGKWLELVSGGMGKPLASGKVSKGLQGGLAKDLSPLTLDMPSMDSASVRVGEFLREEWLKAGVKVNVQYHSYPDYRRILREGKFQLAYVSWSQDLPDPEDRLQLFYGPNQSDGVNFSSWQDAEFDREFAIMRTLEPSSAKDRKVQRLDQILEQKVVRIAGVQRTELVLLSSQLRNFRPGELFRNRYKHLRWEK